MNRAVSLYPVVMICESTYSKLFWKNSRTAGLLLSYWILFQMHVEFVGIQDPDFCDTV